MSASSLLCVPHKGGYALDPPSISQLIYVKDAAHYYYYHKHSKSTAAAFTERKLYVALEKCNEVKHLIRIKKQHSCRSQMQEGQLANKVRRLISLPIFGARVDPSEILKLYERCVS